MRAREIAAGIDPNEVACGWRGRGLAWLDGDGEGPQGRWSFVACEPVEVRQACWGDPHPLAALPETPEQDAPQPGAPDPALVPRWIGFVAYDAAWSMAEALGLRRGPRLPRKSDLPVTRWARYDAVVAVDHEAGRAWIVGDDEEAVARAEARLAARERTPPRARAGPAFAEPATLHREAIAQALEAIADGEIYQVNLARGWSASFEGDPIRLFCAMRAASPVPFGAYLEDTRERWAILSRSMERFLRLDARDGTLVTRPIKGTIARIGDDQQQARALREDGKERAEHAMIVDLMRNDLGRVAAVGSVRVHEAMTVEPYAGLLHLVSTVRARLRPDVGLRDVLAATFPAGSITGAPKLRAMEIIEALERAPRGVYCGAIGYVDRAGGLSLAVAIRTATIERGIVRYAAGGGIVEASWPEREVAETELKASVFLDALAELRRNEGLRATTRGRLSGVV